MNSLPMLSMKSMAFDIGYHNCYSTTLDTAFFSLSQRLHSLPLPVLAASSDDLHSPIRRKSSERNMCHCSGFQFLWILLCLRIGSGKSLNLF